MRVVVQSFWERGIYINRVGVYLMDIEHLIERGRQGDEAALGSLYGAYHRRMTAICQRIVGDRRVAEELFAEAQKMAQLRYKTYVRKTQENWED